LSHGPAAFLTAIFGGIVLYLSKRQIAAPLTALAVVAGSLCMALAINEALTFAVERHLGAKLFMPPHLSARVIGDGPGQKYLANNCATERYILCRFVDRIQTSDAIISARIKEYGAVYLVEDLDVRKRLRDENLSFVRDAIMSDIPGQIYSSARNVARLLLSFKVDGWGSDLTHTAETYRGDVGWYGGAELTRLLPNIGKCELHPDQPCGDLPLSPLRIPHYASVILGTAFLAWHLLAVYRRPERLRNPDRYDVFSLVCLGGVASNALVCGVLSGAYDRYSMRVVWIVPAVAGAMILLLGRWNLKLRQPAQFQPNA
jgi:hypothetical protein